MGNISIKDYLDHNRYYDYTNTEISNGSIYLSREEDNKIKGIVIGSNACDIRNNHISKIIFFPIYDLEYILFQDLEKNRKKNRKMWRKILKEEHHEFLFIAKNKSHKSKKLLINDNFGGIIDLTHIFSLRKSIFLNKYPEPYCNLSILLREKLSDRCSYLFNRTPLKQPKDENLNKWINTNLLSRYDIMKVKNYIDQNEEDNIDYSDIKTDTGINGEILSEYLEKLSSKMGFSLDNHKNITKD